MIKLEGDITSMHFTHPLTEKELKALSSGFCLAVWICPDSGVILDCELYPHKPSPAADIWHHAYGVWVSPGDRQATIHNGNKETDSAEND